MIEKKQYLENYGLNFLVPFFFGSCSFALKSSSKSHQMTTLIVQNDKVFTKTTSFSSQFSFWMKKGVIWGLFSDDLRARERGPEKALQTFIDFKNNLSPLCRSTIYLWCPWSFLTAMVGSSKRDSTIHSCSFLLQNCLETQNSSLWP